MAELTIVLRESIYNIVKFEKEDINEDNSSDLISCAYILATFGLDLQIIGYSCPINSTLMVRLRFGEPLCNETLSLRVLDARFAKPLL